MKYRSLPFKAFIFLTSLFFMPEVFAAPGDGSGFGQNSGSGSNSSTIGIFTPAQVIIILVVCVVIFVVVFSILFLRTMRRQMSENKKLVKMISSPKDEQTKIENDAITKARRLLVKTFSYDENRVIKRLMENEGWILQSHISRLQGMGKVKTHRVIKDLEKKQLVFLTKEGKTNRVEFTEDAKDIFLKKL